jgi:GGDEF domain-containing protein
MRSLCLQLRYIGLLWLIGLGVAQATATGPPPAMVLSQLHNNTATLQLLALGNVPASTTVAQVAAGLAGQFLPFNPDVAHQASWEQPMWLHFRVRTETATPARAWTLALDKPFIDRVELYARSPEGSWQMQVSGDWTAHTQWPVRSLNPQFHLPTLSAGEHDFYVRVMNLVPLHFALELLPTEVAQKNMHNTLTIAALVAGCVALMWLLSCVLTLVYRHAAYAWYALYLMICGVLFASYLGIGSYALWPNATWWPEESITLSLMAAMLAQTLFCRTMFAPRRTWPALHHAITVCTLLGCLAIVLYIAVNNLNLQMLLFILVVLSGISLMLACALHALREHRVVASLWLAAYLPFLMVLVFSVIDGLGWYALPWLPYRAPVYALLFEMPLLLVALHLHAKALHTRQVRETTLAYIDPATGYVPPHLFTATLEDLWQQAQDRWQDMVVAYVLVVRDAPTVPTEANHPRDDARSTVRRLRTVLRNQDTIARVKPWLYAVFMPGQALNDALAQRLARLVAVGLMADVDTPQTTTLRFRVVASSKAGFSGTWQQLDATMRKKLHDPRGWSRKSIRYVRLRPLGESLPESGPATLSQLWETAREESARLDGLKS